MLNSTTFFQSITAFVVTCIAYMLMPNLAEAQIYYVSDDTLWVQQNSGAEPIFIAEGGSLPINSVAVDTSGGYVYWTQDSAFDSEIYRADLDSLKSEVLTESPNARGIALDTDNGKMYWADLRNDGAIYRANMDGSETEELIAGESNGVTNGILDIDLDEANGKMYWVKSGAIMSANIDGGGVSTVVEMASYIQPTGITLDTQSEFAYWTDSSNDEIRRVPLSGGDVESIADADSPAAIDIEETTGKIYWVEDYLFSGQGGAIYRSNLDGSEKELVKEISFTRDALFVTGWSIVTSAEEGFNAEIPQEVELFNNYPNPFNPQTVISYNLPEAMSVSLNVYNFLGQKVRSLISSEFKQAGSHKVSFEATNLPSGTYFYQIKTNAGTTTQSMTLIK